MCAWLINLSSIKPSTYQLPSPSTPFFPIFATLCARYTLAANNQGMKVEFYLRFRTSFGQSLSIRFLNDAGAEPRSMEFLNEEFWYAACEADKTDALHYQYIFTTEHGEQIPEAEKDRKVSLDKATRPKLVLVDTWNDGSNRENAFYTTPFREVLFKSSSFRSRAAKNPTHTFRVKAPLLEPYETVCLLGNTAALHAWNTAEPLLLEKKGDWWQVQLDLSGTDEPLTYKYGIWNHKKESFAGFESGANRLLPLQPDTHIVAQDGFMHLPQRTWKGAGVSIPVFSLKSEKSFGIGEFTDLKLLADWAAHNGLKLIQVLPVNDTTATNTWVDSYPYAAISAFALHPIYINLSRVAGKKFAKTVDAFRKKQKQLNSFNYVDYEKVMQFKIMALQELYELNEGDFLQEKEYKSFFEANRHWLVPYAAFCFFRDKYGSSDFSQWKTNNTYNHFEIEKLTAGKSKTAKSIRFYYFVQYHLHLQLQEAAAYAHKKGVVLKGDIPIGVYRYGCDTWTAPELYNMDRQAGAPPDDFAVKGQNWGFPTYNWQRMQQDGFEWWRRRFEQMSSYFDAFRIDHILGFFRIWSIPAHAVEGILGVFVPSIAITVSEFGERGIWFDYNRFCKPFITSEIVQRIFGNEAEFVFRHFLDPAGDNLYSLKEAFDTQKKIEAFFSGQEENEGNKKLMHGLFDLVTNVILFEQPGSDKKSFHFRISVESTTSFQYLDDHSRHRLKELYVDYFYRRQDEFWKKEALRKLPALKESTNMLICGEDLGMVPHCVPEVMNRLGILSLEIQRMPKNPQTEFFHPKNAPYLSVITPSTHDMSTIRGWWEEDRQKTQRFYNHILEEAGEAPYFCEAWINRAIILQHLYAPAMWSIFQLQDLLGMSETLRRADPREERINDPSVAKHFWKYRMHLTLEELLKEDGFNNELKDYIHNSGRA